MGLNEEQKQLVQSEGEERPEDVHIIGTNIGENMEELKHLFEELEHLYDTSDALLEEVLEKNKAQKAIYALIDIVKEELEEVIKQRKELREQIKEIRETLEKIKAEKVIRSPSEYARNKTGFSPEQVEEIEKIIAKVLAKEEAERAIYNPFEHDFNETDLLPEQAEELKEAQVRGKSEKVEKAIHNSFEYDFNETEFSLEQLEIINNTIDTKKESAVTDSPKENTVIVTRVMDSVADAGKDAVDKGKSWNGVRKAMDDAFKNAIKFVKDNKVVKFIKDVYNKFVEEVKKAWNKVVGLVHSRNRSLSVKGKTGEEKGYI